MVEATSSKPQMAPSKSQNGLERTIEQTLFHSRWLLAPFYLGLAASLVLLLIKFVQKTIALALNTIGTEGDTLIVDILSLVDLSLVGNLVLMVMLGGYSSFVSHLDVGHHRDRPDWLDGIGFGVIKLKLMTSIVAISAIQVLEDFIHIGEVSNRELAWAVGIHLTFIVSAVLLALMDRISGVSSR